MEHQIKQERHRARRPATLKRKAAEPSLRDKALSSTEVTLGTTQKRPRFMAAPPSALNPVTHTATTTKSAAHVKGPNEPPATPQHRAHPITPQHRSQATPKSSTRKSRIPTDPINIAIYELRKEGKSRRFSNFSSNSRLGWNDVATRTNATCNLTGDHEVTGPACYSRFFRNGPLVAKHRGEAYERDWYLRMTGPVSGGEEGEDSLFGAEGEEEGWAGQTVISKEVEAEILEVVKHERACFWAHVMEVLNAKLELERDLTEEDVKAVYDRSMRG